MYIQRKSSHWSISGIFVVCCGVVLVPSAMAPPAAWAQKDNEAEISARKAESALRANELALKRMAAQLEERQRALEDEQRMMQAKLQAQQKAFEARQKDYEKALAHATEVGGRGGSRQNRADDVSRALLELEATRGQLDAARRQMAQMGMMGQPKPAPLPENAQTRVFALRYSKAPQLTSVLAGIVGDRGLRMAVDERSNSLVVSGDEKAMSIVEALVQQLDQSADRSATPETAPLETLQLRIIWLLDGVPVSEPNNRMVSPEVLDALSQLGFESPAVVCQQINTMTLGDDKGRARFQFELPVLVNDQTWQLRGGGSVTPAADHRFGIDFELQCAAPDGGGGGRGRGANRRAQLSGSIYTPLGHYTVMGTTTFVESGNEQEGPQQHLSAFVVYLDRAPEFPAEEQVHSEKAPR